MTSCEDILECLDALVDGELSAQRQAEVASHLRSCESCRRRHGQLVSLIEKAGELSSPIEPETDLWPGVAARLQGGQQVIQGDFRMRLRPIMLIAAAVAVGFSLAVLAVTLAGRGVPTGHVAENEVTTSSSEFVTASVGQAYASIEVERQRVRVQLLEVLEARGDEIAHETRQTVIENLEVIDEAFGRIVDALEDDPNSPELNQMMLAAYYSELGMLRQISKLPAASQSS